ncbi:dehydrogenase [Aliidongia dinghuensis]|uniref:Dehydrogenase n=1 Tax=Aliidongia dinghuensis TaxID=1867774 RepID=A0A8J2YW03_9PROT|nr:SDR family oxidoreductase [Aliidongia dinghuensis]GGF30157.1 dehydrogenase [Aliidongia dinghuensis]
MRLAGKVAIITGAARGIGRACAERFLQEGAKVVIADIDGADLAKTATELDRPSSLLAVETDVTRRAEVGRAVTAAVERFGRLDIMLNNAGIARKQDFLDIAEQDFDDVIGVNLKGAFFGAQAAARQMIAQGQGGVIINMSSINALLANPNLATYAMSKGGMNQLTAVAAVALAPHQIRVVGIGPGTILTEMVKTAIFSSDEARHAVLSRTPIGRCGEPSEIASAATFLASDDASYMTGQTIYPDGGRLVLNYTVPVEDGEKR